MARLKPALQRLWLLVKNTKYTHKLPETYACAQRQTLNIFYHGINGRSVCFKISNTESIIDAAIIHTVEGPCKQRDIRYNWF